MSRSVAALLLMLISACTTTADMRALPKAALQISQRSIGPISIGITEAEVTRTGLSVTRQFVRREGESELILKVEIGDAVFVSCAIDDRGRVVEISSTSPLVRDEFGLGVGSVLASLRQHYPQGAVLVGDEDGYFATFSTGTPLLFRLDKSGMGQDCFDPALPSCEIDAGTKVESVSVGES